MMSTKTVIPSRHIFEIPREIAVCSYCNANLLASCHAWIESETCDGWIADGLFVDCESDPGFGDDGWDSFMDSHSDLPYVYWLPVHQKIEHWINSNYRFDLSNPGST